MFRDVRVFVKIVINFFQKDIFYCEKINYSYNLLSFVRRSRSTTISPVDAIQPLQTVALCSYPKKGRHPSWGWGECSRQGGSPPPCLSPDDGGSAVGGERGATRKGTRSGTWDVLAGMYVVAALSSFADEDSLKMYQT